MTKLGQYYIRQAGGGGGRGSDSGIGPIYCPAVHTAWALYRQFSPRAMEDRATRMWGSTKSLGRKALRTVGKIMTEIADTPSQTGHILSQHATETTQNIIKKLRGGSRKTAASRKPPRKHHKAKRAKITKRKSSSSSKKRKALSSSKTIDIFVIRVSHYHDHVWRRRVYK